jgi:hypothetical protein
MEIVVPDPHYRRGMRHTPLYASTAMVSQVRRRWTVGCRYTLLDAAAPKVLLIVVDPVHVTHLNADLVCATIPKHVDARSHRVSHHRIPSAVVSPNLLLDPDLVCAADTKRAHAGSRLSPPPQSTSLTPIRCAPPTSTRS